MLTDTFFKKLSKIIKEEGLTNNELYQVSTYLQRRYLDNLVKDNIISLINNMKHTSNVKHRKKPVISPQS